MSFGGNVSWMEFSRKLFGMADTIIFDALVNWSSQLICWNPPRYIILLQYNSGIIARMTYFRENSIKVSVFQAIEISTRHDTVNKTSEQYILRITGSIPVRVIFWWIYFALICEVILACLPERPILGKPRLHPLNYKEKIYFEWFSYNIDTRWALTIIITLITYKRWKLKIVSILLDISN